MPRNNRKLSFPRTFSVMTSKRVGKVLDLLRLIASTETWRPSTAEITRRVLAKGLLVEACEHAWGYETGQRRDLAAEILSATPGLEKVAHAGVPEEDVLWAVLTRMWPESAQAVDELDMSKPTHKLAYDELAPPGPPLTAHGRSKTVEELRDEALADIQQGVKAPTILPPPRTVAEAKERARQETEADRLAMARGVDVSELLARTPGGAGLPRIDESAGAQGWASDQGKSPQVRERRRGRTEENGPVQPQQGPESYGAMLRRLRNEEKGR